MSDGSRIEWLGRPGTRPATWNPVRGCSPVSPGCANCYAARMATRFAGPGEPYEGLARAGRWTGTVRIVPEALTAPLRWRTPRTVFVASMSDLFHECLPDGFIAAVYGVMAAADHHTFILCTKRAERMRAWFQYVPHVTDAQGKPSLRHWCAATAFSADVDGGPLRRRRGGPYHVGPWPLPNVWLLVTAEDQQRFDERVPHLLACPAAVRGVSMEPLLGPVDINRGAWGEGHPQHSLEIQARMIAPDGHGWSHGWLPARALDWIIVGGESGPRARACDIGALRSVVRQAHASGVPCFVKQLGAAPYSLDGDVCTLYRAGPKGADPAEWPEDVRVREWPVSQHIGSHGVREPR